MQSAAARGTIDNTPSAAIVENLRILAAGLETVRSLLAAPLIISSGYRCPALNALIGGAKKSQHMEGLAADFISPAAGTPAQVCQRIASSSLAFDQLIYEYTWCHISFGSPPRRSILTFNKTTGGYRNGVIL